MEHQEIYEWLKELAFKNCDKENREQIFWFFEDILEDEIKVEKQEDEIERLNIRLKTSNDTCNYLRNTIDKAIEYIDRRDIEWGSEEHKHVLEILDKGE